MLIKAVRGLVGITGVADFLLFLLYWSYFLSFTSIDIPLILVFSLRVFHVMSALGMLLFMFSTEPRLVYSVVLQFFVYFIILEVIFGIIQLVFSAFVLNNLIATLIFLAFDIWGVIVLIAAITFDNRCSAKFETSQRRILLRKIISIVWQVDSALSIVTLLLVVLLLPETPYFSKYYFIVLQILMLMASPLINITLVGAPFRFQLSYACAQKKSSVLVLSVLQFIVSIIKIILAIGATLIFIYVVATIPYLATFQSIVAAVNWVLYFGSAVAGLAIFGLYVAYYRVADDDKPYKYKE